MEESLQATVARPGHGEPYLVVSKYCQDVEWRGISGSSSCRGAEEQEQEGGGQHSGVWGSYAVQTQFRN